MENNDILIKGRGERLSISVCIDRDTGVIDRAEITDVSSLTGEFVTDLLIGYDLRKGAEKLLDTLEKRYYGDNKEAVEDAMRCIFDTYSEICRGGTKGAMKS